MIRMIRWLALLLAALALPSLAQAEWNGPGRLIAHKAMPSRYIGTADVLVWLPPGYDPARRYAVLYMHDAQNLFDPATSSYNKVWGVDRVLAAMIADGAARPTIVVGIDHKGPARGRQYLPQKVYDRLAPADRARTEAVFGGKPFSDDYLRFLVEELKPFVDATYATDPGRSATFVAGSSMGGLISLYALAEYPDIFGGAACLSTHWPLAVPKDGDDAANRIEPAHAIDAMTGYLRGALPRNPDGRKLWFDHGTATLDANYAPYQARIDALMPTLGWKRGRDWQAHVYPGAEHEENAWRARLADPLSFLLAPPR